MEKDQIHTLTDSDLASFPLEDFFDRYEQGLRSVSIILLLLGYTVSVKPFALPNFKIISHLF